MGLREFLHRFTAPKPTPSAVRGPVKLVCIVNQSLDMGKGKLAAQVGHASVEAFLRAGVTHAAYVEAWLASGQKKIVLKAPDASSFHSLTQAAQHAGIPAHIVHDAGHTQVPKGSPTVLALGPFDEHSLDAVTGELKLL